MSSSLIRLAGAATVVSGCVLTPIDRSGLACDERGACIAGYVCDEAANECVRELPLCEPGCRAGVERCTSDGCALVEYVPGQRAPAGREAVTFVLPPSIVDGESIDLDFDALPDGLSSVDPSTLDVLLVPPRTGDAPYAVCRFTNLPVRGADRPLVIASTEGPVRCGFGFLGGGSHWVLTGRHDEASGIGDPSAPGHDEGYADTRGRYGFEFLHSLEIDLPDGTNDVALEIEHVEISGRPSSAHALLYTTGGVAGPGSDVRIHDLYVHDGEVFGEAMVSLPGVGPLAFYRNRLLRAVTSCMRAGVTDGAVIRNNVFSSCSLGERATTFTGNAAAEIGVSAGRLRFDANIVAYTGELAVTFLIEPPGDPAQSVSASDDVVSGVGGDAIWARMLEGQGAGSQITLRRWSLADFAWRREAIVPGALPQPELVRIDPSSGATLILEDVAWSSSDVTREASPRFDGVVAERSGMAALEAVAFSDYLGTDVDPATIERWHATTARPTPGDRSFEPGAVVIHEGRLYRATDATSATDVPGAGGPWAPLPMPPDDTTLRSGSAYHGIGVDR